MSWHIIMKSIKLDTTVPVDPSLQPIGDPFYSGHGDDFICKNWDNTLKKWI